MFEISLYSTLICTLLLFQQVRAATEAWHLDYTTPLAWEQLDPIVSPNAQSSHMHQIIGGSRFRAGYDQDDLVQSKCSTVRNQIDMSNYWVPQLYWFYYFLARNSPSEYVSPFPKGLRMLVGDPSAKSPNAAMSFRCQTNPTLSNPIYSDNFNYNRDCPNGLKSVVNYPSCWDGINLWKGDMSHVVYSTGSDLRTGPCPISHPIKIPQIQLEVGWFPSEVAPGKALAGHMVVANGDTTSYGYHADFINGWNMDILTKALNTTGCVDTNDEIPMEQCPVFAPYFNQAAQESCTPEFGQLQEPTGNTIGVPIAALPGCNPIWKDGPKPTCDPMPQALDVSSFLGPNGPLVVPDSERRDIKMPTTPGWSPVACMYSRESITNYIESADPALTVDRCTASCGQSGYNYAAMGMRPTPTCLCGTGISPQGGLAPGQCNTPCPGNATQMCGDNQIFSVYAAPNGTTTSTAKSSYYIGCLTNPNNGLTAGSDYNFWSFGMTNEVCAQACTEKNSTFFFTTKGNTCYCGRKYDIGTGVYQPDDYCAYKCTGNSSQFCGDSYRASVYNLSNIAVPYQNKAPAVGSQGCYYKPSSGLALSNSTWTSASLTVDSCLDGCKVLGYKYSAVDGGKTCSCGDVPNLGDKLPSNQCNTACTGNSTQTCGGSLTLELFNTSASSLDLDAVAASRPAGWLGCYTDSSSAIALSDYSYKSSTMTSAICKAACAGFKYPYAGLDSSNECSCGATPPKTTKVAPANCNSPCAGNSTETCGANNYMDVFNSTITSQNSTSPSNSTVGGASYKGCFQDSGTKGLSQYMFKSNSMTIGLCTSGCKELGFSLAAVEYSSQCYCGNTWQGQLQLPESSCNMPCNGNTTQICGAGSIASLYDTTNAPAPVARIDSWLGCYTDNTAKRTLSKYSYAANDMTVNVCRAACALKGYSIAGVENGKECYCDNAFTDAVRAPAGLCSTTCPGNSTTLCGGAGVLDAYNTTGAAPRSDGNAGFVGCFADYGSTNSWAYSSDALTSGQCQQMCILKGYKYAATRNSNICQCGNTVPHTLVTTATCNLPCSGNATQTCGTSTAVNVYDLALTDVSTSAIDTTSDTSGFVGCFQRGTGPVLDNLVINGDAKMTNALCTSSCGQLGYTYSGTMSGKFCYCGNSLNATSASYRVQPAKCNSACLGDSTESCGAGDKVQVYSVAKTGVPPQSTTVEGYTGCYAVGTAATTSEYVYNYFLMSATLCRRICRNKGYSIAALNGGRVCACSNTVKYGAVQPYSICSTTCPGNATEICGQGNFASVYNTNGAGAYPPTANVPANFVGCYNDESGTATNALGGYSTAPSTMSSAICANTCQSKGFSVFGTQGNKCYCGNGLPTVQVADDRCGWNCNGFPNERCGGGGTLSVYNTNSTVYVPPASSSAPANGSSISTSSSVSATASASNSTSISSASITPSASSNSSATVSVNATSTSMPSVSVSSSANVTSAPVSSLSSAISTGASSFSASVASSSSTVVSSASAVSSSSSSSASSATATSSSTASASSSTSTASQSATSTPSASSTDAGLSSSVSASTSASNSASSSDSSSASTSTSSSASTSTSSSASTSTSTPSSSSSSSATSLPAASPSSSSLEFSSSSSSADVASSTSVASSSTSSADASSTGVSSSSFSSSSSVTPSSTPSSAAASTSTDASSTSTISSSTAISSSASSSSTAPSSTSSSAAPPVSTDANYLGCYSQPTEIVSAVNMTCSSLLPNMCKLWCKTNNYEYSGMSNGNYCGCTNDISQLTVVDASQCGTSCVGDASQKCGGSSGAFSIFRSVVDPVKRSTWTRPPSRRR